MGAPFMQLYVGDYVADTMHFSTEQHGAYMLILMAMWRCAGRLACDEETIRQVTRLPTKRWNKIKLPILEKFELTPEGFLTQGRLAKEFQKATAKSQSRSQSGKAGAAAKALKNNKPRPANAKALLKHSSEPEPEDSKKPKSKTGVLALGPSFPNWWPVQQWQSFCEMRKKKRAPLTDRAVEMIVKDVTTWRAAGQDPAAVFDQSIRKTWTDVYPLKGAPSIQAVQSEAAVIEAWVTRLAWFHFGRASDEFDDGLKPGHWEANKWGPKPGADGCRVPDEAIKEFARQHPVRAVK